MKVFISHSSVNADIAEEVCATLEANEHTCFLAPRDIRIGYEYAEEIVNGIDSSGVMLLLLSEEANNSPHVLREIERAVSKKIPIIVYKLEEVVLSKSMEYFLLTHQWINGGIPTDSKVIVDCINNFDRKEKEVSQPAAPSPKVSAPTVADTVVSSGAVTRSTQKRKLLPVIMLTAGVALIIVAIVTVCVTIGVGSKNNEVAGGATTEQISDKDANDGKTEVTTEATTGSDKVEATNGTGQNPSAIVKLGDTVTLGKYNSEAIDWRVIKISDDGKQAVVIANNILTMKAFDAAESGTYNQYDGNEYWTCAGDKMKTLSEEVQIGARGNNQWSKSNIRTWLNSSKANVTYEDQVPSSKAMSDYKNGYNAEAGFLNGFSEAELNAIVTTKVTTGDIITQDKVFLLSEEEITWLVDADVSKYAIPTDAAITQDQTKWYKGYALDLGVKDYYWWLRSAGTSIKDVGAYEGAIVCNSNSTNSVMRMAVGVEGYGIRPAMTIDLTSSSITIK